MSDISLWAHQKMIKKPRKTPELKGYSVRLDPHDQYLLSRLLEFFSGSVNQNELLSRAIFTGFEKIIRELALYDESMQSLLLNELKSPDYREIELDNPDYSRDQILEILKHQQDAHQQEQEHLLEDLYFTEKGQK